MQKDRQTHRARERSGVTGISKKDGTMDYVSLAVHNTAANMRKIDFFFFFYIFLLKNIVFIHLSDFDLKANIHPALDRLLASVV